MQTYVAAVFLRKKYNLLLKYIFLTEN